MIINHNIAAMNTHRQLGSNNAQASKNLEKLSSGLKINRAGDDAAGLAISEKMRAQIRGLDMAQKNSQDGISLIQTAEGALNETHSILQRMRELAVQAGNDTNVKSDREEIQKELNQLTSEINRIGNTTEFNTKKLTNGELSATSKIENGKVSTVTQDGKYNPTAAEGVTDKAAGATFKDGKINITAKPDEINWDTIAAGGTLGVEKTTEGLKVTISAEDGAGNKLDVTADFAKQNGVGDYVYDAHGVSFTISKADYEAMADGDGVDVDLEVANGGVHATAGSISTKNDYTKNEDSSGDLSTAKFTDGITVTGANAIPGASSVKVEYDGTDFNVTIFGEDGTTALTTDKLTPGSGTELTYDNHGIKFTLDAGTGADLELTVALDTKQVAETKDNSAKFQIGANEHQSMSVGINDMRAAALGLTTAGTNEKLGVTNGTNNEIAEQALDVSSHEKAAEAVTTINNAIELVSAERSKLGAVQNRLEHTINNLGTSSENLTAAESRIRDVDMAKEMMDFTKNNILTQAAQAMLAQANQQPQGVLQLLR